MAASFVAPKSKFPFHLFSNLSRNPDIRSVEGEVEKALYALDAIADYNFGDLKKIAFNRATRTDKRVHALQNVFSCKVHLAKDMDEEVFRGKLNAILPKDIKVFCVVRCSNRFNAKITTSSREYSYYLPSFMLTKMSELFFGNGKDTKEGGPAVIPTGNVGGEEEKQPTPGKIKIIRKQPNQDGEDNEEEH
jgi:tRNA U38,U39,U40 pseudouridine synthase TruA